MLYKSFSRFRFREFWQPWQEADWLLFLLPVALTLLGGVAIRSTQMSWEQTDWWQHWAIGGVGVVIVGAIARWRYEMLLRWQWVVYGVTNISLIAVMVVGTTALGAQRWLTIGSFNVQPSEFSKLGIIIVLAAVLHGQSAAKLSVTIKTLCITAIPWALVFLQPDLGTSLVFGAIVLGMLYWANAHTGWLILLVSPVMSAILFGMFLPGWFAWVAMMGIVAWWSLPWSRFGAVMAVAINLVSGRLGRILWGLLKDYQKDRLILFMNPEQDPLGGGYHLIQSRIAIGAGEFWGRGLTQGSQTQGGFIPEQHTDFIFSAIGEELGFVGCIAVLLAFWLICLRLTIIAQNSKDNFGSLLAIGVLSMLLFQVVVNVSMTIGLAPVTGIPLPWLSYGRSALLTNFIAIGLVESVANHRQRLKF
jgi:rod shape determining protein RodA